MNDRLISTKGTEQEIGEETPVSVWQIFREFLIIGASRFGGGLVAYLQRALVGRRRWIDEKTFLEFLSISQSLPGLNTTNMAILVGDRLRGARGALAAILGVCLPGGIFMLAIGILYQQHGDQPLVTAMLKGVSAAAVGMVLSTILQLSRKALGRGVDFLFVALTVVGVLVVGQSVPRVLLLVGAVAVLFYRPQSVIQKQSHDRERM